MLQYRLEPVRMHKPRFCCLYTCELVQCEQYMGPLCVRPICTDMHLRVTCELVQFEDVPYLLQVRHLNVIDLMTRAAIGRCLDSDLTVI